GGQVCWGAPVDPTSGFAKDPATWDPAIPDNYVDCVAYGPYTGPQRTGAAPPTTATPGDGVHSLDRTTNASNDFALDCPTPTNNGPPGGAEVMGTLGTCTTPPTSTTTTTTSTTTTTTTSTTTTTLPTTTTSTTTTSVTTTTAPSVPPACSAAVATPAELWPPNHQLVAVSIVGVTDGDLNPPTVTITGVTQDEPVGATCPDATGVGTSSVKLRS